MTTPVVQQVKLILIGPRGVGKSTIAELVARRLGLSHYSVDNHCFELYCRDDRFCRAAQVLGADASSDGLQAVFERIARELGGAFLAYQEGLHLLATRAALTGSSAAIIDLGSGHCAYTIDRNQVVIGELLRPFPTVCLWPSEDPDRAVELLLTRNGRDRDDTRTSLEQSLGRRVARHVVFVRDRSPEAVADEVMAWVSVCEASPNPVHKVDSSARPG